MFLFASLGRTFWLAALAGAASIAIAGTAFTASLTVPTSNTATGTTVIGAYSVASVSYTLNGSTPTNIDAITFKILAPPAAPGTIKAKADNSGIWYTCSSLLNVADYDATCNTTVGTQLTVGAASNLTLVISQ